MKFLLYVCLQCSRQCVGFFLFISPGQAIIPLEHEWLMGVEENEEARTIKEQE